MKTLASLALPLALVVAACGGGGSDDTGTVQVFVQAEDTIPDGLTPGSGEENIIDGWTVTYDKFLYVIGDFTASQSAAPDDVHTIPGTFILDMKNLPAGGFVFGELTDLEATRWDRVGFSAKRATADATVPEFTAAADAELLTTNGWSLYVTGTLTKPDGESCLPTDPEDCVPAPTVTFELGLDAATSFADCASPEGDAGFAVPSGGAVQVSPTIHGDHWFFSNITQGAEITDRRAQWIADADLDRDGATDLAEMALSDAADLFPAPDYSLTGAVIPVNTGADYVEAQARTLGDYNGEGECPTRTIIP